MNTKLPSSYYRVTIKAIIRDDQNRLLVGQVGDGSWEVPGGGWEHDESFEDCVRREIKEELGVVVETIGSILFTYQSETPDKTPMLRLATEVTLASHDFTGQDMMSVKFVTKEELLQLHFVPNEVGIKKCVDKLWP